MSSERLKRKMKWDVVKANYHSKKYEKSIEKRWRKIKDGF